MEVILRYIRNVSSLKKIELKNHKNRTKNKKVVNFYETFLVLENTAEALCKGYLPHYLWYSNKKIEPCTYK